MTLKKQEDSDDEDYTAGDSDHDNDKADEADDDYDYDSDDGRLEEDDENIGESDFIGTSDASTTKTWTVVPQKTRQSDRLTATPTAPPPKKS